MKKLVSLLLALVLCLAVFACAEELEPISFTATTVASLKGQTEGYKEHEIYKYIAEKFNIDVELWESGWGVFVDKESNWLTTGTMPDTMLWASFSFPSYFDAIDQGLIKALPEDWETKWPNIAHMVEVSGIADLLNVDGKVYAIPHPTYGNFFQVNPKLQHNVIYFRKDFAAQVGMEDLGKDYTITLSEYKEYLEKVNEAGLTPMKGFGADRNAVKLQFAQVFGTASYYDFFEGENGFEWSPKLEGTKDFIKAMQEWYQNELINVDFYNKIDQDYIEAFQAGQIASIASGAAVQNIKKLRDGFKDANPEMDPYEVVGLAILTADDGSFSSYEELNYWTTACFHPDLDEKKMERILDVMDYIASAEGYVTTLCGVPGVQWEMVDGQPTLIEGAPEFTADSTFVLFGYCDDDFSLAGVRADIDARDLNECKLLQAMKEASNVYGYSTNYDRFNGESKSYYSVDIINKITEIVCDGTDVDTAWDAFIAENEAMWQPLLDDLNNEFYK